MNEKKKPTVGSLFAGIGGLDLGFEQAGFETRWQVELSPINRAVLGHRFPRAKQFEDVRHQGAATLGKVDYLLAGFPCQDISNSGARAGRPGLRGARSGLFYEVVRYLDELQPEWVVLDAAHFGSPAKRRRVFMVGRLGGPAPLELLSDAAPVDAIPASFGKERLTQGALAWPGNTLQASNATCRISLGSELLVAEADGWHSMVERERTSARDGIPLGLDERDWAQVYATGNAVSVQCAKFIAQKIIAEMKRP